MISHIRTHWRPWFSSRPAAARSPRVRVKLFLCGGEQPVSEYPLGLGYLKTNCQRDDVAIEIVKHPDELVDCDLIGLSTNAWGIRQAVDILEKSSVPIVLGGQGTLWDGVRDYPFQHIVVGEGEAALGDVIDGTPERIIRRPQIEDVDSLKFPERGRCGKTVPILTSRGCPFRCRFCSSRQFWDRARFHSADYFIDEVEYLLGRYRRARVLYTLDDLFIADKKRLDEICKQWIDRRLHRRLKLRGFIRSGMLDRKTAETMKRMGFDSVRFGAESGSDRVLELLGKGTTIQKHQETIETAVAVGLPVSASFMYDIPGETDDDREQTRQFIERNKDTLQVEGRYKYQSFPGTDMYAGENPLELDMRVR